MKRTVIAMLGFALIAGFALMSTGCASTGGPYFQRTRDHKPHVQRDRIHNPADYRYAQEE